MARIPRKGLYVNPDGTVCWAWSLSEAHKDLEYYPPVIYKMDGTVTITADPEGFILDIEDAIDDRDINNLLSNLVDVKIYRQQNGQFAIKKVVRDLSGHVVDEIDHPAIHIRSKDKS